MKIKTLEQQFPEINEHISLALERWSGLMLTAEADRWAYYLEYTGRDLFNALYIFNHVAQNIGIKNGTINDPDKATEAGLRLRELVKSMTGFDSADLAKSIDKN